jgi:hypothetical protein
MGWDGMGWDGMGWDGMGWDGMGWDGMGWVRWDGMDEQTHCIATFRLLLLIIEISLPPVTRISVFFSG